MENYRQYTGQDSSMKDRCENYFYSELIAAYSTDVYGIVPHENRRNKFVSNNDPLYIKSI